MTKSGGGTEHGSPHRGRQRRRFRNLSLAGATAWLLLSAVLAAGLLFESSFALWNEYGLTVIVASAATFVMYGWDKRQAQVGGRRIPEATLHFAEMIGGWPGALFGQEAFRHKTQKASFRAALWTIVVVHVGAVTYLAATGGSPRDFLPVEQAMERP